MSSNPLVPGSPINLSHLSPTPEQVASLVAAHSRLPECSRFALSTPALVSEFGVIGLSIIDSRPGNRWVSYSCDDWFGVPYRSDDLSCTPLEPSHFLGTETGFAIARIIALPEECVSFLKKDPYLGPALIDKCCEENTTPENLDEVPMDIGLYRGRDGSDDKSGTDPLGFCIPLIREVLRAANNHPSSPFRYSFEEAGHVVTILGAGIRSYLSFHAWPQLKIVEDDIRQSIVKTLLNFDQLFDRFHQGKLDTQPYRILNLEPTLPRLNES